MEVDIQYEPAYRLREMILDHQISSKELLELFLERTEKENSHLNAFITVRKEEVRKEVEKCSTRSLLGLPIAVEDTLQVKGTWTSYGSLLMNDYISQEDDLEILRLKEAGAVILGKTNLSEFGFSPYTQNKLLSPTLNPLTQRVSLGSSGGAAVAVAAGCVPFAIGTDTTGGIRLPAYDCRLFGLKPTRGRIPLFRSYLTPTTEKLFHQKGLIARDPRDLALLLHILAKPDPHDHESCIVPPLDHFEKTQTIKKPLKIGFSYDLGFLKADSENLERFQHELEKFKKDGHELQEVPCNIGSEIIEHFTGILACDRYLPLLSFKEQDSQFMEKLDSTTCRWFCQALEIAGIEYAAALYYMQFLREEIEGFFKEIDFLVTPCLPQEPHDSMLGLWGYMLPFSLSGHPSLVTPGGVQMIGKYYEESFLLRVAGS